MVAVFIVMKQWEQLYCLPTQGWLKRSRNIHSSTLRSYQSCACTETLNGTEQCSQQNILTVKRNKSSSVLFKKHN